MNTCTKKDFQVLDPGSQTRLLYRSKFEVEVFTESDPGDGEGLKVRYKCVTCLHERNRRSAMFRHIRMKHIDRKLLLSFSVKLDYHSRRPEISLTKCGRARRRKTAPTTTTTLSLRHSGYRFYKE